MKLLKAMIPIAMLLQGTQALAQAGASLDAKPSFSASQTVTTTARVEAVNHETREVTLLLQDGELLTSRVGDDVRNLDQVGAGDMVYAHYTESISIQVVDGEGAEPESEVLEEVARSAKGKMPGVAAVESVVNTSIVEEINIEDSSFKLREADGEVRQYRAMNPENLRRAKVGDQVITTVTTSVVVTVEKRPGD